MQVNPHASQYNNDFRDPAAGSLDMSRLGLVFKKSIIWYIIVTSLLIAAAIFYIRYTPPIFESSAEIKLNIKSEANLLGLNAMAVEPPNYSGILSEIEMVRSRLFLSKVVEGLQLEVSVFTNYGTFLNEEKYKNAPFEVVYEISSDAYFDVPFYIELIDESKFRFTFQRYGTTINKVFNYGDSIKLEGIDLIIKLLRSDEMQEGYNKYFFLINSPLSLVRQLESNLIVEPLNFTANTIKLRYRDQIAAKARDMVDAISKNYVGYTLEEKNKANKQKIDFLNEQLTNTESKLEQFETYFEETTIANRSTDLQRDLNRTILILENLDSQQFVLRQRILDAEELANDVRADKLLLSRLMFNRNIPAEISAEVELLSDLMRDMDILGASYRENTYAAQRKKAQIERAKNMLLELLEEYLQGLRDTSRKVAIQKASIERNFTELPAKGTEVSKVKRFYSLYEEFYMMLMQKKAEFEIAQAGTVTDFVILSPASMPHLPIRPQKLLAFGIAAMLSAFFIFLITGVRYLTHNKVTSLAEMEKLSHAAILGAVPVDRSASKGNSQLLIRTHSKSKISEAFRSIRTNLDFLSAKSGARVISVTSTVPGEGKTFVSVNLGAILALSQNKVCVLDMDMRKPKIHFAFQEENSEIGVSTLLIGKYEIEAAIKHTEVDHLKYIPAGPIPPNPSELLLNGKFQNLIDELRKQFDVIILDSPPVGLVTDGMLIMQKADIPIYVLRSDYSLRSYLQNVNKILASGRVNSINLILNAVNKNESSYGYGYSSGGGYYEDSEKYLRKTFTWGRLLFKK